VSQFLSGHGPETLVELLDQLASNHGDATAYSYRDEARSYADLWSDAQAFAAALMDSGVEPGDRVVMALPNGHEFFNAFYGSLCAGGIAVPIFPRMPLERIAEVARLCEARHIVVSSSLRPDELAGWRTDRSGIQVLTPDRRVERRAPLPPVDPDDVAFIQYTSGSTGDPKGVQLSHSNLITNMRQMIAGMEITDSDRFVSWLPSYHDMGLILMTMVPLYMACPLFLLPATLRDLRPWLKTISRYRATFTASPDTGYRVVIRQASRSMRARDDYDLSSLRVALSGAEPARRSTIDSFHQLFGIDNVMVAGYGLAEATVGVSMWKPSTRNGVDERGVVSVGRPFPDVAVKIVDDADQPLPPGSEGHIVVDSPAVTRGYLNNPQASQELLVGPNSIRTGDIGYLDADGHLYVLGRSKDVIIQAGRTLYPAEVEEAVNSVSGVRHSAAIGVDHGGIQGEQLTVFAAVRPASLPDQTARRECVMAIARAVHDRMGIRPARVHLVAPRTIPNTPNGKLQRSALRERYESGMLDGLFLDPERVPG
jgi:acyl-CoA synthetase (AMP-forming)/AMP-acid ligase II